ncbi:MAG: radical SAM protein [Peptococcaceae bacterium]|nr:radical SAM protein [Peptococcaceae bacterium]
MIISKHADSPAYNFYGNTDTGLTLRWGETMEANPLRAPWPELADISISNHCTKGCAFCYRNSSDDGSFMTLKDYETVLAALTHPRYGSVFQVALGGGEPLEHPRFYDLLQTTKDRGIVANFTTNGEHMDRALANKLEGLVGAVALSIHTMSDYLAHKARLLMEAGIKVNVHFVLDKESLPEAIALLNGKYNELLAGINAVIFLTYKPKGRAVRNDCLSISDERFNKFVHSIDHNECDMRIGFDACFVPVLLRRTTVDADYIDSCECGFFSVYIDEKMNVSPCSFANDQRFRFNLRRYTLHEIWNEQFAGYRLMMLGNPCADKTCANAAHCRGKCYYYEQLSFCHRSA